MWCYYIETFVDGSNNRIKSTLIMPQSFIQRLFLTLKMVVIAPPCDRSQQRDHRARKIITDVFAVPNADVWNSLRLCWPKYCGPQR